MITKETVFMASCDLCDEPFSSDGGESSSSFFEEEELKEALTECDWKTDGDKHYCPECTELKDPKL